MDIGNTIEIREAEPSEALFRELIRLSEDWEAEGSCWGYRRNDVSDLEGRRIFTAESGDKLLGYLFGRLEKTERTSSVMPAGTVYFEVEELYVIPALRSRGLGGRLFRLAEESVRPETEYIMLSTATRNWRSILHFYIEELGMDFWNARLFKKI